MATLSKFPEHLDIELDDYGPARLLIKYQPRARRYGMRMDPKKGATLVIPKRGTMRAARQFVERYQDWLVKALDKLPQAYPFAPGAIVPLRGINTELLAVGGVRGVVREDFAAAPPRIMVPGDEAHFGRKVTDWLKREARKDIEASVTRYEKLMGLVPSAVRLGDTISRWGSCSASGTLSFSWRLILAPPEILDYLVVHEMAHLQYMDHSKNFWSLVERYCPDYRSHKKWLVTHGNQLFAYGRKPAI